MTDEKKYHLLIFFPKGEPHQYHYFSNDKYVARYVNQPKWCRGLFSTNEKEDIDSMINWFADGVIWAKVGIEQTEFIDETSEFHIHYIEEWGDKLWIQPKAEFLFQIDDEEDEFWQNSNSSEFGADDCKDEYIKNILIKFNEANIGNEENFYDFLEEATKSKWEDSITVKENKNENAPNRKIQSQIILESSTDVKHKLLKKKPKDIDFENYKKTLKDFKE